MQKLLPLLISLMLFGFVFADNYGISVTRDDQNIYKVDNMDIYIETNYCYEYVYYEDVTLSMIGSTGELIFDDDECPVKAVYGDAEIDNGRYDVTVSQKNPNWYEVVGTSLLINTMMCLELSLMDSAILDISFMGRGELIFDKSYSTITTKCTVEGVYGRLTGL